MVHAADLYTFHGGLINGDDFLIFRFIWLRLIVGCGFLVGTDVPVVCDDQNGIITQAVQIFGFQDVLFTEGSGDGGSFSFAVGSLPFVVGSCHFRNDLRGEGLAVVGCQNVKVVDVAEDVQDQRLVEAI